MAEGKEGAAVRNANRRTVDLTETEIEVYPPVSAAVSGSWLLESPRVLASLFGVCVLPSAATLFLFLVFFFPNLLKTFFRSAGPLLLPNYSHGRGDRGEGETQVQPGLSHAADERQEGDELAAKLQRHLHASGAAAG